MTPSRDLPPRSRARIRAELIRVADGPAPRRRVAPLVAAAGLTALVAAGVWVLPDRQPSTPAAQPSVRLTSTAPTTAPSPFPGLSAAQVAEIERGCARVVVGDGGNPHTPGVTDSVDTLRLRVLVTDELGTLALLVGENMMIDCTVGGPVMEYNGGLHGFQAPEDGAALTLDAISAGAGGKYPNQPGSRVVAGRLLDAKITRVEVRADGRTQDAAVRDGAYLARFVHTAQWSIPEGVDVEVRGYDANGALVASVIT